MAFTILHTADLHLGKSFSMLSPERAEQRRADLLATWQRLCRKARELRVDLFCVAGDLFDRVQPSAPLLAAARQALSEVDGPVLLLPGNHDSLEAKSPYVDYAWPAHVLVAARGGWQRMAVNDCEVWAFGYQRGETHHSPWEHFPGCGQDALLALHAACLTSGLEADAGYYPFTPHEIPICGYLALGHHHRQVQVSRRPSAWYAGSPEPLAPEITPAAALLVTLESGTATVEPLEIATRHHHLVTLEVTGLTAGEVWDRALALAATDQLLQLHLSGVLDVTESLDLPALQAELTARCFAAEICAETTIRLPNDCLRSEGAMGALLATTQQRIAALSPEDPQRLRLERAMRYAALALEGRL